MFENIKTLFQNNNKNKEPDRETQAEVINSISPHEYFNDVKARKQQIDDEGLQRVYDNCMELLNKYIVTGQERGIKKLMFHLDCIEKERELVKMGIDTFVYKDDIEEYIDKIASDVVKIIELENYEREIPDEIIDVIYAVKEKKLFDQLYVVFTDYTGKVEKRVAKERRDNDPILFGAFMDTRKDTVIDRFYYLGDWEDEFCHLTLDKMVNETRKKTDRDIRMKFKTPEDIKEYREQLKHLKSAGTRFVYSNKDNVITNFISRV